MAEKNKRNSLITNMRKMMWVIGLLFVTVLLVGCTTSSIADVQNPDYVGKKVTVSGTVENTIKIGDLSGYTLKDESGAIRISSETLPAEGSSVSVSGTVIKDTIFGYYIKAS